MAINWISMGIRIVIGTSSNVLEQKSKLNTQKYQFDALLNS